MTFRGVRIHPTADVSEDATVGQGTQIWHQAHIRERAVIGERCIIGKDVYVDFEVIVGNDVKIQNSALLYHGLTVEDGVMIGPRACFTNDRLPRAITPEGQLKGADDWDVGRVLVRYGAGIGAGAIILPGVTIGRWSLVGAGAVVTKDVPNHGLVVGVPATLVGYVCRCGGRLKEQSSGHEELRCQRCGWTYRPGEGDA
jgi:acetyltransferase-like isoleucine patch superfamily enzyme